MTDDWGVVNPAFQKAQCESLIKHVYIDAAQLYNTSNISN